MTDIIIRQPDPSTHESSGLTLLEHARAAVITCNEDRELAGAICDQLREEIQRILLEFDGTESEPGPCVLSHKTWKSLVALRSRATKSREDALAMWTAKAKRFEYDVEQKRLAESRKADALARKKAEEDRQQQILEAKRLGDREAVENLKQAPISVVAVAPKTPEVTKAAGLRRSAPDWDWRLTDMDKLPRKMMVPDEKAITALVKRLGPKHGIPGITVFDARAEE